MTPRSFSLSTRLSFSDPSLYEKVREVSLHVMVSTLHFGTLKRMMFSKL